MRKIGLIFVLAASIALFAGTSVQASPSTYTVMSGDCLWTISNHTGVGVDTIKQLNSLNSDLLKIGQVLTISTYTAPTPVEEPVPAPASVVIPAPSVNSSQYLVVSGDNLWSIAQRYGTSIQRIMELNGLSSDALHVGDSLVVSGTVDIPAVSRAGGCPVFRNSICIRGIKPEWI
jgi:LysM repeat protein